MKKLIAVFLTLALALSLCACGKSKDVKNVETQIASLNANSTYKEINDVYKLYKSVPSKDREKVDNVDILAQYCDISSGHFVLTESMMEEIEENFKTSDLGFSNAQYAILWHFTVEKNINTDWNDCGNIEIVSTEKDGNYNYAGYGSMKIQDKYGAVSSHNVEIQYFSEFDEEEEPGYKISSDVVISK